MADTNILLAMLLVFGGAKLLGEVFERLKQPAIVGEIIAGVILGPSVLGWIKPNEVLTTLAELGVMFLLFRVGLEVKSSELMRVGGTALVVAVLGVVLPFAAGWGILAATGAPLIEALFVGAAMVATSVGITAQVLARKGLLQLTSSRIILGAAIIDDVLGLIVLAMVSSMAKGKVNIPELALTAVAAAAFTFVVAKWGSGAVGRVVPRVESKLSSQEALFNVSLVLLFGLAVLATFAGVAAIIGAFLAGMALAESATHRVNDLVHGVTELLMPFFLVGIGLHLDVRALADPAALALTAVIVVAAVLTKLVGCGLGALSLGWTEALRIGAGMVPRGEVGMVVAQIGFGFGVIPKSVYSDVVMMAILTTLIAPPLINLTFRNAQASEPVEEFKLG
jgi:Kef-type K+ transport system membrane component KefB